MITRIRGLRARTQAITGGAILLGAGVVAPVVGTHSLGTPTSPDTAAIQAVVRNALNADQQADVRPAELSLAANAPDDAVRAFMEKVPPMSHTEVLNWHARLDSTLSSYYTGTRLDQLKKVMGDHADEQTAAGAQDIELGGGAENIQFESVVVSGDTATARVQAEKWLRYVHRGNARVEVISVPPSTAEYVYRLVRTTNGWRISDLTGFKILTNAP